MEDSRDPVKSALPGTSSWEAVKQEVDDRPPLPRKRNKVAVEVPQPSQLASSASDDPKPTAKPVDGRARPTTKPLSARAWLDAMLDPAAEVPAEVAEPANRMVLTPAFMAANSDHQAPAGPGAKPSTTAAKGPRMADGEVVYVPPANSKVRKIERDRLRLEAYKDRKRGLPATGSDRVCSGNCC